jgi:hypothetical protein
MDSVAGSLFTYLEYHHMTTIVKTINPANKAVEQINVNGTAAPINVAPGAIVEIQAGRAQVASFIQNGKNLVLVMVDGTEIVLQGYFDNAEGNVKKLILTEENGSVEVQFPAADGSVADGASVDVAPSYVAADAATTTSLAEAGAQDASTSGVSPVLLGVLGAIGVGALAAVRVCCCSMSRPLRWMKPLNALSLPI